MNHVFEMFRQLAKEWRESRFLVRQDNTVFKAGMAKTFDRGKRISDFIGMIVRLTFTMVFTSFSFTKIKTSSSLWHKGTYGTAFVFGLIVTIYFASLIGRIVLEYLMQGTAFPRKYWIKLLFLLISLYLTWSVISVFMEIAWAIAGATKLAP